MTKKTLSTSLYVWKTPIQNACSIHGFKYLKFNMRICICYYVLPILVLLIWVSFKLFNWQLAQNSSIDAHNCRKWRSHFRIWIYCRLTYYLEYKTTVYIIVDITGALVYKTDVSFMPLVHIMFYMKHLKLLFEINLSLPRLWDLILS